MCECDKKWLQSCLVRICSIYICVISIQNMYEYICVCVRECVIWLIHAWHDSFVHVTWLIHTWHDSFVCVIWLINTRHDSFVRVAWLIHTWHDSFVWCGMTVHTRHDSFVCVTWLFRMCDMIFTNAWHDSFVRVIWLIHSCGMTHSYVWYESFIIVAWLIFQDRHYSADQILKNHAVCVCVSVYVCVSVWTRERESARERVLCRLTNGHDSFICVRWLVHMCDKTHSYVWHDSFVRDMTHLYVQDESFIFDTTRAPEMIAVWAVGIAVWAVGIAHKQQQCELSKLSMWHNWFI